MSKYVHPCGRCGKPAWGTLCAGCYQKEFAKKYPRIKSKDKSITHGTHNGYRRGCRCQPCTTAATNVREARKRQLRQRRFYEGERFTTIRVSWGRDMDSERAHEISRHVAREISKFKGVEEAHVVVKAPSERGLIQPSHTARGSAGMEQPDRLATKPDRNPRSERASGNGDLDLLKIPSFKARGKGKSLLEVVNQLTERS